MQKAQDEDAKERVATHHKKKVGKFFITIDEKKKSPMKKKKEKREMNGKSVSCFFGGGGSFALTRWEVVPCVGCQCLTKTRAKRTQREAYRAVGPAQSPYGHAYVGLDYHAD